ncbi:PAS domain S-box protein [Nannocystis exedens]|uniref:PAS domain S-box protein n=1 Tax=Nannocystis exedens TaxID=54 RepID=UPI00147407F7|nr:PAS domain S-box protein [Nannocystis exedens]
MAVPLAAGGSQLRLLVSLSLPFLALAVQSLLWRLVPSTWFLFFYPAIFFAAALAGLRAGLTSTALSAVLVWWFFVPPAQQLVKHTPAMLVPMSVFIGMGVAFSVFHERLRRAERDVAAATRDLATSLVEQAPDGILIADDAGRLTEANPAACHMLGYSRGELLGLTLLELLHTDDSDRIEDLWGLSGALESSVRRKDGTELPVEIRATRLTNGRWQAFVRDVSARRRVEEALRERQSDLDRAQSVAGVGSWQLDLRRDEVHWSDECYRLFGVPHGTSLTYGGFLDLLHPDDRADVDRAWRGALAGAPFDVEHRIVVAGEVKWIRERAEVDFDGAGLPLRGIGTMQDITLRKRADEALRRAHDVERRLRAELEDLTRAAAAVSEAVADLPRSDLATVLQVIARQAQTLTDARYVGLGIGTDPAVPFDPWIALGMPEEVARQIPRNPRPVGLLGVVARDNRIIRTRDLRRHAAFGGFPPGHPDMRSFLGVPIRFHGRPVGNFFLADKIGADEFSVQDQRLIELLAARAGAAIEIATRYVGEAFQRAWLQAVIDQLPEGVIVVDSESTIVLRNRVAAALARRSGLVGHPEDRLYDVREPSGAPVPFDRTPANRALRGETLVGVEYVIVGPDGRALPVLVSATPLVTVGEPAGAAIVFQDITALKELERLREEWTSVVAHDLRQPVAVIELAVEGLLRGLPDAAPERARRGLERIKTASRRLGRMIDDLLDASRIESRRLTVQPRRVDLAALAAGAVEQARETLPGAPIRVVAEGPQPAWVDPDRIQQVLDNLLSNAVKYGEPGREVRVDVGPRDDAVELVVTNHGAGIAPDQQRSLFCRFARTREAREGPVPGLGLGLYISRGIVEAHGGRMWVESTPGATTSFHCLLPRGPAPD